MSPQKEKDAPPPRWAVITRDLMKKRGVTQEDMKDAFMVTTRGAVGHYLRGIREPNIEQFLRVAAKLRVTVSQLIGEVPLTPGAASTNEIYALLAQIDEADLPLLMSLLRAAASASESQPKKPRLLPPPDQ